MKIRDGYVSNSSSSSYLVKKDCTEKGLLCLKLTKQQIQLLRKDFSQVSDIDQVYLTQYTYDCYPYLEEEEVICVYDQGGHFGPYSQQYFNKYDYKIYLQKKHDKVKQMTFKQFTKQYMKEEMPYNVLVQYKEDGVFLRYVND